MSDLIEKIFEKFREEYGSDAKLEDGETQVFELQDCTVILSNKNKELSVNVSGGYGTATGYYCPYELNEKCPHDDFDCCESENKTAVFEDTVTCIDYEETGITLQCLHTNVCGNIGEYIFLTREEAEQKLKEMESG